MAPQRRKRESSKARAASFSPYGRDSTKKMDDTHYQPTSSLGDNTTSTQRHTLRSASKAVSTSAPDFHNNKGPLTPSTIRYTRISIAKPGTPHNSVPFEGQHEDSEDEGSQESDPHNPRNKKNVANFPHPRCSQRHSARTLVLQRKESTHNSRVKSYNTSTSRIKRVNITFPNQSNVSRNISEVEKGEGDNNVDIDADADADGDGDVEMAMEGAAYPGGRGRGRSRLLKARPRAARGRGRGKTRTMTMVIQSSKEEEDEQPPHSKQDKQDNREKGAEEGGKPERREEDLAHPRHISLRHSQHAHPHQIPHIGNTVTGPSLPNLATAFLTLQHHHHHVKSQNPHKKKINSKEKDSAAIDIDLPGKQVQRVQATHNKDKDNIDMLNTTTAVPPTKQTQANVFTRITTLLPTSIPRTTIAATATATTAAVSWYLGFLPGAGIGAGRVAEARVLIAENVVSDSIKVTMFTLS